MQSTLTLILGTTAADRSGTLPRLFPALCFCLGIGLVPLSCKRRKYTVLVVALAVIAAGLLLAVGCGGGASSHISSSSAPVLPSGKITVVAASGNIQHRSTITLAAH